jgi:20S proteasome subunit beta 2
MAACDVSMSPMLQVYPHGSTDSLPFATMGSGSLNAMAVFEANYKDNMTKEEGMTLVARAIKFGAGSHGLGVLQPQNLASAFACGGHQAR